MPKKIMALTEAQQHDLVTTYVEWLSLGRSREPVNMDDARVLFGRFYAAIGEPAPAVMMFPSPAMCILAYGALCVLGQTPSQLESQLRSQLRSQLWSQLGSQLWSQLGSQLWSQLGSQLWSQLESQLRSQLESQLRSQLESQLRSQLLSQLWSQLGSQLWSQLGNYLVGDQWAAWKVFYDFCRRIGVRYSGKDDALLDLWMDEARTCHWWWPYKGLVLASQRPTVLHVDDQGRLHCPDGLAIGYADGWGVYAWHGLRIDDPDLILKPETVTVERITQEPNAELRRMLLERFGFDRFVTESGALPVHTDDTGTLYRVPLADDEPLTVVRVLNATPEADQSSKAYLIRVPPTMQTARESVAWTFGQTAKTYQPAVET